MSNLTICTFLVCFNNAFHFWQRKLHGPAFCIKQFFIIVVCEEGYFLNQQCNERINLYFIANICSVIESSMRTHVYYRFGNSGQAPRRRQAVSFELLFIMHCLIYFWSFFGVSIWMFFDPNEQHSKIQERLREYVKEKSN